MGAPAARSKTRRRNPRDEAPEAGRPTLSAPSGTLPYDLIAFDGDDTLWDTQPLYEAAKDEFEHLCRELGLWGTGVRSQLDRVDAERVASLGFSRNRFPGSLVQVIETRAAKAGITLPPDATKRAWRIGEHVFEKPAPLRRAVPSLMAALAKHYRLILVTKGDRGVQVQRVRAHDLSRHFESVHIVRQKSPATLRRIFRSKGVDPSRALVVGDSLRSDIHPALAIGASALWIPSQNWRFEHAELPTSTRFSQAESLDYLQKLS